MGIAENYPILQDQTEEIYHNREYKEEVIESMREKIKAIKNRFRKSNVGKQKLGSTKTHSIYIILKEYIEGKFLELKNVEISDISNHRQNQ